MRTASPFVALAFLLPAPLVAQGAPTKAQLVGTWVSTSVYHWTPTSVGRKVDSTYADLDGKTVEYYLTLDASGTFSGQSKSKTPVLVRLISIDLPIGSQDSALEKNDTIAGEGPRVWGQWSLTGDSLKFGRNGRYAKYPVVLQGSELKLLYPIEAMSDRQDRDHHQQCARIFTRVEAGKPLPASLSSMSCQTLAGTLPSPKPPALKAAGLLGTWVSAQPIVEEGNDPLCAGLLLCTVIADTLTFQADSTLVHNFVRASATTKEGKVDTAAVKTAVKLRWWIASDTLLTAAAAGQKPTAAAAIFEDNGQYLIYEKQTDWGWRELGPLYRRATVSKP